jgi:hypothetical protein
MPTLRIEAFTFEYNEVQDRIRLSGNLYNDGEEVSFWVTRRLALKLLKATTTLVEKTSPAIANAPSDHRSAMAEFEHQSAQMASSDAVESHSENANFEDSPSKSDTSREVIVSKILSRVDISFKDKHYKLSFFVESEKQAAAYSVIEYNQLHQVLSLIHRGAVKLDWGVDSNLFSHGDEKTTHTLQ